MVKLLLLALMVPGSLTASSDLLWYRQPAKVWNEALPIGSGRLGGMIFGDVPAERIQLNEDTVWAGELRDRINAAGHEALPQIRRLLFGGKPADAEALADRTMIAIPRRMPPTSRWARPLPGKPARRCASLCARLFPARTA